jgi:N-acetylglucosamine-6-phosphate deacetylase
MSAAAVRPALAIGLDPRIRPGARADLVLLGADGVVEQVMRAGRWVEPAPTRVGVPGGPSAA